MGATIPRPLSHNSQGVATGPFIWSLPLEGHQLVYSPSQADAVYLVRKEKGQSAEKRIIPMKSMKVGRPTSGFVPGLASA